MNEFDKEEHTEDIWYSQIWCKYCINGFYCKLVKKHKG